MIAVRARSPAAIPLFPSVPPTRGARHRGRRGQRVAAVQLAALLALSAYAPHLTFPPAQLVHDAFLTPFLAPEPSRPPRAARRKAEPSPPAAGEARPRASAASAAPASSPAPDAPSTAAAPSPAYGRWTVAPGAGPPRALAATGLPGCAPQTLQSLTGQAREACAGRLTEMGRNGPGFPLVADPRKAKALQAQAAYGDAVRAWRSADAMGPHPCPPQDERAHRLYLDTCSLVNPARRDSDLQGRSQSAGVKLEFKYKF